MKINREEFLSILSALQPGLSSRDIVESLSGFNFCEGRIYSFNDQVSVSHRLPGCDFNCCVDGQKLKLVVQRMTGEEIDIKLKKDSGLSISSGKDSKASLKPLEVSDAGDKIGLPSEEADWSALPADFVEGMTLCSFSVSKDLTRPYLTCLAVKDTFVVSSDNIRISLFTFSEPVGTSFMITGGNVRSLIRYPVDRFCQSKGWIHFSTKDSCVFSCKEVAGEFPDVSHLFTAVGIKVKVPRILGDLADEVSVMTEAEFDVDRFVEIAFSKAEKKISCSGKGRDGSFEKSVQFEERLQRDFTLVANPAFLRDVLKSDTVMTLMKDFSKALFERKDFRHIMCLPIQER